MLGIRTEEGETGQADWVSSIVQAEDIGIPTKHVWPVEDDDLGEVKLDSGRSSARRVHGRGLGRLALTKVAIILKFATCRQESGRLPVVSKARVMADESRESLEAVRLEKLEKIAALGHDPWGGRFEGNQAIGDVRALEVPAGAGSNEVVGPKVRIAGRIMLRRGQGKVNFLQLRDWTGALQVFVGKNQVGDAGWALAAELDLGDLIGVDGTLGFTKTGELTVFATALTFLGKSLLPPPEKWHGLTDVEQRTPSARCSTSSAIPSRWRPLWGARR